MLESVRRDSPYPFIVLLGFCCLEKVAVYSECLCILSAKELLIL